MRPVNLAVVGIGVSAPIVIDQYISPCNIAVGVTLSAGAVVTYTVEHTFDDVFSPTFNPATAAWFPHATLAALAVQADGNYFAPPAAIRLNVAASNGTVTIQVRQAGIT